MRQVQVNEALPEPEKELKAGDNKIYEIEVIIKSVLYDKKADNQMSGFYYLVLSQD